MQSMYPHGSNISPPTHSIEGNRVRTKQKGKQAPARHTNGSTRKKNKHKPYSQGVISFTPYSLHQLEHTSYRVPFMKGGLIASSNLPRVYPSLAFLKPSQRYKIEIDCMVPITFLI